MDFVRASDVPFTLGATRTTVRHVRFRVPVMLDMLLGESEYLPRQHTWIRAASAQTHTKPTGIRSIWLKDDAFRVTISVQTQENARDIEARFDRVMRLIVYEGTHFISANYLGVPFSTRMERAHAARKLLAEMEAVKRAPKKRPRDPEIDDYYEE